MPTEPRCHHRRRLLQGGLALASGLLIAPARACEFYSSNLRITHPWTRATPQDAAFATVCMKFDEVMQDDRLIGVETPVAEQITLAGGTDRTDLDFAIPAGRETWLSEAGVHLRLSALRQPLEMACTYPMRLIFERGGSVNADLSVDYLRFR